MSIPEDYKDQLVDASLNLMRVLSDIYGSDRAMEFWTTLSDTIDPDLKGLTFSAMLTGRLGSVFTIKKLPSNPNKVGIIKAIRTWDRRKLGLKEAMDLYNKLDSSNTSNTSFSLEVNHEDYHVAKREFVNLGCITV